MKKQKKSDEILINVTDNQLTIYDINLLEKQLKEYNKKNGVINDSGVDSIINNCKLYNMTVNNLTSTIDSKVVYLLLQLNTSIIKYLQLYSIVPSLSRKNVNVKSNSKLNDIKK